VRITDQGPEDADERNRSDECHYEITTFGSDSTVSLRTLRFRTGIAT
jgi:hypothetical protein